MTRTVIPFRRRGDKASALATFDAPAAELLADGRAATLSAAQFGAILTRLRAQRDELGAIFADLETRAPSGDTRLDTINADLSVEASKGLAHIDWLIQHAETCAVTP
ncbi:hypothetical protein [Methylobacterium sp. E-066]|uniref:hypothetical protein n=1 Tax=Methylobacterium sp. E-066 TaxID=2836584 RepID=UPI001FB9809A|nr:hypothetical protein [Methylobacterium sp. E-066]MCJ2139402.1 hypothetical protein [Methylobacterium sp. E-066]